MYANSENIILKLDCKYIIIISSSAKVPYSTDQQRTVRLPKNVSITSRLTIIRVSKNSDVTIHILVQDYRS